MDKTKTAEAPPAFGKWRARLWPIHTFELKKLLPMLFLFFCILFNYTILRDTKDTLIVTAAGSGAEAIPFLKVWGVLPGAFLFMFIYSQLSNKLSKPTLFYSVVATFIAFFVAFALVLYPNREALHPHDFCNYLQELLPKGCMGLVAILRNWTFSLFYILSELWGSACLSLLFWGFANDITKFQESKRFYSLFGMGANFSLIVAGLFIRWASNYRSSLKGLSNVDPWQVSLNWLVLAVFISGMCILGIYWWINKYVLTDARFYDTFDQKKMKKEKPKLGFLESLKVLGKSRYMFLIAIIVVGYGMSINLIEVTWKSQLKLQFPNSNDYSAFMGKFSMYTGVVSIFMMLFVAPNMLRVCGWKITALTTPIMILITGGLFFSFMIFSDGLAPSIAALGTTPLMLAVVFGMIQNIASKSTKYALFDPTKEMTYIPLDQERKIKGKAAVDVVGARLGKAGGSLLQQGLIVTFGSIAAITPYVAVFLLVVVGAWLFSVNSLDKDLKTALANKEEQDAKEKAAAGAESKEQSSEQSSMSANTQEATT